jgi:hypothetical protein
LVERVHNGPKLALNLGLFTSCGPSNLTVHFKMDVRVFLLPNIQI